MRSALQTLKVLAFGEPPPAAVAGTYIALLAAARNPFFFTERGVPDTIDGRFEVTVLHLFLLAQRLREEDPEFVRFLSEAFFDDMDRAVRELGVMDTGLKKRIARMGKAYHGRLQHYTASLGSREELKAALARNLYGTVKEGDVALLDRMADFITNMVAQLAATPVSVITAGEYRWPDPTTL